MHVLIVPSEHFVTRRYPVGGIFQQHQANALHRAGFQVGVVAAGVISPRFLLTGYPYQPWDGAAGYPVLRRYARKYVPHRWMPADAAIELHRRLGLAAYRSYVSRFGMPDVVHAHNINYAGFIAREILRIDGVPFVLTEHSSQFLFGDTSSQSLTEMVGCARASAAMTAVSSALARAVTERLGVSNVSILPNIVDPFLTDRPLKAIPSRPPGATAFLAIGSLDANKNHAALIEAFGRHFKNKGASLRIVGTGPLHAELKALARRLDVASQVVFLGALGRERVVQELQAADALVLPSLRETFGVVLIEALACGRPVIATRCGGPGDVVTEANGLMVDPGDVKSLGSAMVQMAATLTDYDPARIRAGALAKFGEEAFVANAKRFYLEAKGKQ